MSRPLSAMSIRRRFLMLRALRWLPSGLLIPVIVLLLLDRGLNLAQVGLVFAAQGLLVLVLELPTGGLADTWGRRNVLLFGTGFEFAAFALLAFAQSLPLLALAAALLGIYRALESGPLDSWFVDESQNVEPDADIERGLAQGGVVLGIAIAVGALLSSALVLLGPLGSIESLVLPVFVALGLVVVEMVVIAVLMAESGREHVTTNAKSKVADVIRDALRTVRGSRVLVALVSVEFLWGFGMVAFESFPPAKLGVVMESAESAAAVMGPANTVAWLGSAAGAALVPALTRRWRPAIAAAGMRVFQGLTVVGIALAAGPVGVVLGYIATLVVHGAANPVHQGLLHRAVDDPGTRATVVSANSLTASTGGMIGGIFLGLLADQTSLTIALLVGAVILAIPVLLYLRIDRVES